MSFRFMSSVFRLKSSLLALLVLSALAPLSGCNMVWRRILPDPAKNQVVRV